MDTQEPSGIIKVYYCSACPGIYTKDASCPSCNTDNNQLGFYEKY